MLNSSHHQEEKQRSVAAAHLLGLERLVLPDWGPACHLCVMSSLAGRQGYRPQEA